MTLPLQNMSAELKRAYMHALFTALNRESKELTLEDMLVGMHKEFGELMLKYFEPQSAIVDLIDQISRSACLHDYSMSKLFEAAKEKGDPTEEVPGSARAASFRGVPVSKSLMSLMAAADVCAGALQRHSLGLRDVIRALKEDSGSVTFFQSHGIKFRKDEDSVEAEATKRDEAGNLPLEEVMKLFDHWMKTSTRVMCAFRSGTGSISTSLGAWFQITGKVGIATESHAQVRIDAEKATETSCLLDLRGSSTKLETWNQLAGDARMEFNPPVRLEIRLATGDRCTVASIPSFAYRDSESASQQ